MHFTALEKHNGGKKGKTIMKDIDMDLNRKQKVPQKQNKQKAAGMLVRSSPKMSFKMSPCL